MEKSFNHPGYGQGEMGFDLANGPDLSVVTSSNGDSLWQTKTPEEILSDMHSLMQELKRPAEEYEHQRFCDPLAHHIELLIEQAIKEPNVKRAQRLMTKINKLRYRQIKLVSVYMRNGAGLYFVKD